MTLSPARLGAALVAGALTAGVASAQVRFAGSPKAPELGFAGTVPTLELPPLDAEALLLEDELSEAVGPLRFGIPIPIDLDFEDAARWTPTPDGEYLVGQLRFVAEEAKSVMLEFSRFELPRGARAFLYDDALETVYGAYTSQNGVGGGGWSIEPFPGANATLEIAIPADARGNWGVEIADLVYDYRDFFELERGLTPLSGSGGDGGCQVDVNCPEGDPYDLQKRAVVRTVYQGGLCSGSLINNTESDGTQFLYTADHCGTGSSVNVRFNFEKPGCGTGSAPTGNSVSGATLLEANGNADGRLMRINDPIPPAYLPYYPGWSRSNNNLTFGMSMHHPGGSAKKISIDFNGGGKSTGFFVGIGSVKVWNMFFQVGGSEPGSSGSPLFDEDLSIRGTLTGGPSNCQFSDYGRFNTFWNDVNLSPHLDPNLTGVQIIGGFDPNTVTPDIAGIAPSTVDAFQAGEVTLTGSGFSSVTSLFVDGVELFSPGGFTLVDSGTITFVPPPASSLGDVDVRVEGLSGVSNTVTLEIVETSPPKIAADIFVVGGQSLEWNFGGPVGGAWILAVALNDPTTIPIAGIDLLLNFVLVGSGSLDGTVGLGGTSAPIPTGLNLSTLYSQVITADGAVIDDSALASTVIL